MTLFLDANQYATAQDLHLALKRLLSLPDYYGMNLDALHDCLGERTSPLDLYVYTRGSGDVARTVDGMCEVVSDLGGRVTVR